jgi:hypothetical protein
MVPGLGFDSVIVDEGQDFHEEWWHALLQCCYPDGEGSRIAIFHDPAQNVFRPTSVSTVLPRGMESVVIRHSWRNTRQIYDLATALSGLGEGVNRDGMPDGPVPETLTVGGPGETLQVMMEKLCQLLEWGMSPSEIAMLCPSAKSEAFRLLEEQMCVPVTKDLTEWREGARPLLMTWRKFRGLEARAVILFDLGNPSSKGAQTPGDLYTAITRARESLTVVKCQGFDS